MSAILIAHNNVFNKYSTKHIDIDGHFYVLYYLQLHSTILVYISMLILVIRFNKITFGPLNNIIDHFKRVNKK